MTTDTITLTFTRTTYDGTPETLPDLVYEDKATDLRFSGLCVVVRPKEPIIARTMRNLDGTYNWFGRGPVTKGDEWILLSQILTPTPSGLSLIAAERAKHAAKGFIAEHDQQHANGELAWAACYYAMPPDFRKMPYSRPDTIGPAGMFFETGWDWKYAKRDLRTRIEQLTIAGSFCAAEIDRLKAEEVAE